MTNPESHSLDITAFVLAGGKSSRMGTDKGLMMLNDRPMISYVIDCLRHFFNNIIIISNNPDYKKFDLPVVEDKVKNIGPIGGILTGLQHSKTNWNFFIACDLPFMQTEVIELLLSEISAEVNTVVPVYNTQTEPLCAFYNKSSINVIQQQTEKQNFKLQDLISELKSKMVEIPMDTYTQTNSFSNLNSGDDLRKLFIL